MAGACITCRRMVSSPWTEFSIVAVTLTLFSTMAGNDPHLPLSPSTRPCLRYARPRTPVCRGNRFAIQSRRTAAWPGGVRLRQRRFSAIGLSACRATRSRMRAYARHERTRIMS